MKQEKVEYILSILQEKGVPDRLAKYLGTDDLEQIKSFLLACPDLVIIDGNPFYSGLISLADINILLIPNAEKKRYEIFEIKE